MAIVSELKELESVKNEISRLTIHIRQLRSQQKKLEATITQHLEDTGEPGYKYKGQSIKAVRKPKRKPKKKAEKESDCIYLLSKYVDNPEDVYNEMSEAMRGHENEETVLQIKNIKKRR